MALRINLRKIRPGYILKPRGKNLKFVYYVRCGLRHFVPSFWLRRHKAELLATLDARTDKEQILDRVNYYNKLTGIRELSGLTHVSDVTNSNGTYNCDGERQKFCVHGIIGARQTGASNEHEHQTQFS